MHYLREARRSVGLCQVDDEKGFFAWRRRTFQKSAAAFLKSPWRYSAKWALLFGVASFVAIGLGASAGGAADWDSALVRGIVFGVGWLFLNRFVLGPYSVREAESQNSD